MLDTFGMVVFSAIVLIAVVVARVFIGRSASRTAEEDAIKRAGNEGEHIAADIIRSVLRDEDRLLNNVVVSFEDQKAEIDNVVITESGLYVIEVKNYVGRLEGDEDDYEWDKYKTTDAGNVYHKKVRNPIKQAKRGAYVLSRHLQSYGVDVWAMGCAMLIHQNSPVQSDRVLKSKEDIDELIHSDAHRELTPKAIASIAQILED